MLCVRPWSAVSALIAFATTIVAGPAVADGLFLPDRASFLRYREKAYIHEPEQKAAIIFRNGMEDLIISPRFSGPAARFAWVIPTPSRPSVGKVDGALFHELSRLAVQYQPRPSGREGKQAFAGTRSVTVLERKPVGAYDVAVLQADDPRALLQWLRQNDFAVPSRAEKPIRDHVREKWTFVAMRVRVPEAARGLREGTLAPIRLTFPTKTPVYPLRLSSALPSAFQVLVYFVLPYQATAEPPRAVLAVSLWGRDLPVSRTWDGIPSRHGARSLARLVSGPVAIYPYKWWWEPQRCRKDLTFVVRPQARNNRAPVAPVRQ